jgi:hypothetical protein
MSSSSEDDWCCSLFADAASGFNKRGLSVYKVVDMKFGLRFFVELRSIDVEDVPKFRSAGDVPVTLSINQGITFCPWCGCALRDFYADKAHRLPIGERSLES